MSTQHAYRYTAPSTLHDGQLRLVVDDGAPRLDPRPFFTGRLKHPRLQADLLTAIALLVDTRFYTPPNAKERQFRDPIVTAGADVLRFEGFSACGSAWIRVDVDKDGYDGVVGHGTTNVDINPPLRQALARVKDNDVLALNVDSGAVVVDHARGDDTRSIVEKKVPLPARWLRGLVEVQSYLSSMTERFAVSGAVALRFLRALPRATTKNTPLYLVNNAGGLRLTATSSVDSVRIADVQRLRVLEPLVLRAQSVAFFADAAGDGATAVVLRYAGSTLTLALTADVWRGFSGEGQALRALLRTDTADVLARVRGALSWQHDVDADALAAELRKPRELVDDTLRVLGASGLVGFDLVTRRWFHRVLPFDLEQIDDFNPRLVAARALVDDGAVTLVGTTGDDARVVGSGGDYRVRGTVGDDVRCTCPWFAKHQGERGPCKHVLAVELARARATVPGARR